jgi:proteasome lid subunit RPN8/RPN11
MDSRDEVPVVIYHSHTATEAYPSRTDISYASEPGAHYVLVSTREPDRAEFRSFRIVDGVVTEEEVRIDGADGPGEEGTGGAGAAAE